jgi:hypothetical protein
VKLTVFGAKLFCLFTLAFLFPVSLLAAEGQPSVVVYGATPAGIAAALSAADDGESVLLVEPTAMIGGLVTSGLSHTDIRTFESITGAFGEFSRRVERHYQTKYGPESPQVRACERGIFGEPHVNLRIFTEMLADHPHIEVIRQSRLDGVDRSGVPESQGRDAEGSAEPKTPHTIRSITLIGPKESRRTVRAKVYIDATYEGDLMAAAGAAWRVGREGRYEYDESLAPASADEQLQAYNFRFIMTRRPENRVLPSAPAGYRREDFLPVLEVLNSGKLKRVFDYPTKCLFKAHLPALPNDKHDINDVSNGVIRLSLPQLNREWPNGDLATRGRIFAEHMRDQVGLLYFLQNDEAVPASFREEAREWGWCKDEFIESQHIPPQLYVREARRMIGQYVFTEHDTDHAAKDARAVLRGDSIAVGDYGPNCHGTAHEGPRFGGRHTGEFYKPVVPYQIPYGVLVPREVSNLLVVTAVSSSHVGFCALRLEPIWMSLGQAGGHAAHLAIAGKCSASQIAVPRLQRRLHERGSATIYVSDVPPGHADFAAVQWWGLQGGWHALAPLPEKPGQRGRNLHGQYFEAFPNHEAQLDHPLDPKTAQRWLGNSKRLELKGLEDILRSPKASRGDFVRSAWKQATASR